MTDEEAKVLRELSYKTAAETMREVLGLRAKLAASEAAREAAEARADVRGGEWCAKNRLEGRGPCGCCVWCCQQWRNNYEASEAARAKLMEALGQAIKLLGLGRSNRVTPILRAALAAGAGNDPGAT